MNPFLSYTNMKDKYPLQKLYLRIQVDLITPKKNTYSDEYANPPANARLILIIIRQRETETISDGNKIIIRVL